MTNVEYHHWRKTDFCPEHKPLYVSTEIRRRILKAFHTGWEHRYGFYLDDGWIYAYRSHFLLSRFKLTVAGADIFRVTDMENSEEKSGDVGFNEALYTVMHHWEQVSDER